MYTENALCPTRDRTCRESDKCWYDSLPTLVQLYNYNKFYEKFRSFPNSESKYLHKLNMRSSADSANELLNSSV
jgi:hypothetical protein